MNPINRLVLIGIVYVILLWSAAVIGQPERRFQVIVHEDVPTDTLTLKQLSKIYLKKQMHWKNGVSIEPVDLVENAGTREYFSQHIHRKKVSKIKAYWQKQIFTGRGVPPPEKKTDREVLEYVQSHPGGIGYISNKTSLSKYRVKKIVITE